MNRRNAMTLASAGIATALVPAAAAKPASRLPGLIAEHKAVYQALNDHIDVKCDAEFAFRQENERDPILSPNIMGKCYSIRGESAEEIRTDLAKTVEKEAGIAAVTFKLTGNDPSSLDGWKEKMLAGIDEAIARWSERREACGVTAAEAEYERLNIAEYDTICAVLTHRPVSPEDARAKLEYIGPLNKQGSLPDWTVDALLESLLPDGEVLPDAFDYWGLREEDAS